MMTLVDGLMYAAKTEGKDAVRYSTVDGDSIRDEPTPQEHP